jgi:hypothetical protein
VTLTASPPSVPSDEPQHGLSAGLELAKTFAAYLPAALLLPVVLAPPLNHDVAAILDFTQRWIGGEALYTRLTDPNPPLIFVLNLLPAYIGTHTVLDAVIALQACILLLGAVVWWLALRERRRSDEGPAERFFLDAAPVFVLLGAGYDFGQREHLMTLCAVPYLFLGARRARGEPGSHRFAVVALAAVGFALKPYFLGIPALVELYVLSSRGWRAYLRDPVPWVMAAIWTIYLASLPLLFPDYFTVVLPLVSTYYVGGTIWEPLLTEPRLGTALVLLVPFAWIAFRGEGALAKVLSLAAIGAAASALVQRKGWSYHIVPIELLIAVLAGTLAARWLDARRFDLRADSRLMAAGLSMLGVLFVIFSGEAPWRELGYRFADEETELRALLVATARDERVLILSPRVWPIYPAINYAHSHQTWPSMTIWVLQGFYRECLPGGRQYRDLAEMGPVERGLYQTVVQEFAANPPKVIAFDQIPGIPECGKEFDLLEYFKRDPRFAAAWSRYAFFAASSGLDLYLRVDASTDAGRAR